MKIKSSTLIIIILFAAIPTIFPIMAVTAFVPLYNSSDIRAEFESPVCFGDYEEPIEYYGDVPFWVDMVDAEGVSNTGEGVYIAVLDTGLLSMWDFFFPYANIATEYGKGFTHDVWWDDAIGDFVFGPLRDDRGFITDWASGHGTHVVSTIVGYNYNGLWIRGVAPMATIIPVLVLDGWVVATPEGDVGLSGGTDEMVSAGIYYVADLDLDGPVIISMSLGGPDPSPMIEEAINYAICKGVIVVASAGNEGDDGMGWPGAYPQVISCAMGGWTEQWLPLTETIIDGVTYVDPNWGFWLNDVPENLRTTDALGNKWQIYLEEFSSRPNPDLGQKPWHLDVTAPGCAIVGPYKQAFSSSIGYYYLWGTSMAAPHVSAIAALILEDYPKIRQFGMEFILKLAALRLRMRWDSSLVWDIFVWDYYQFVWEWGDYGSGFLQADTALFLARIFGRWIRW